MRVKKRKKSTRYLGSQTHRRGHRKRTRGSGNKGGVGLAGTGKRGDQKKTLVIKQTLGNNYFGKDKALRRGSVPAKLKVINLSDLSRTKKFAVKDGYLDLSGYKLLGDGELNEKLKIKASAASNSAKEKVKSSGGELVLKE